MAVFAFFSFGPLHATELFVVLMAALMIFGGRLPEVALRAVAHVMRARRALAKMWRDTGLEDELRRVRRDIEMSVPRDADFDVRPRSSARQDPARLAAERARARPELGAPDVDGAHGEDEFAIDPDADRREAYSFEPVPDAVAFGDVEPPSPEEQPSPEEPPAPSPVAAPADPDGQAPAPFPAEDGDSPGGDAPRPSP